MADRIHIRTGDMPTGSLKKGKNKVDDVVSTLLPLTHQRGNPLDSIYYVMNGEYHRLFSNGAATLVANCCAEMQNLQLQIETYLAILNSGPGEFEQIDRAAKNSITTWTDRTGYAIGGAFSPLTSFIGGTFSYLFLPRGLTGFFMTLPSSLGQKQKNEQERKSQNETVTTWTTEAGDHNANRRAWANNNENYSASYHKYSDGVSKGSVRYVYQSGDLSNNGWGKWKDVHREKNGVVTKSLIPSGECGYASQSMALSYLGIDASPEYLLDREASGHGGTGYSKTYGLDNVRVVKGSHNYDDNPADAYNAVNYMLENFYQDSGVGNVSPVVIHYHSSKGQHSILLIGKDGDQYLALDPARGNKTVRLTISPDGVIGCNGIEEGAYAWRSNEKPVIDAVQQYQIINP